MSAQKNRRLLVAAAGVAALAVAVGAPAASAAPSYGTVTGRVGSADSHSLAGVVVTGVVSGGCDYFGCDPTIVGTTTSAADGSYRLRVSNTSPGDAVRIQFSAAKATGGTSATGYGDRCYGGDDSCAFGTGKAYTDLLGHIVTGINVTLAAAGQIRGRLTDVQHRSVGGLPVYLFRHQPDLEPDGTIAVGVTTSDVNGNYGFAVAARKGWFVCFGDPIGDDQVGTPAPEGYSSTCTAQGVTTISGRVTTLDAVLQERGAIKGTVVDQSGRPVGGATVTVVPSGRNGVYQQSATTDARGIFRVGTLNVGTDDQLCVSAERFTQSCDYPSPVVTPGVTTSVGKLVLHRMS